MKSRFIKVVFGRAGFGKTTLIVELIPYLPRPVFILDTMNEFSNGLILRSTRALAKYLHERRRNDSGVYILKSESEADSEQFFRIFPAVKEPCSIVVDEVSKFSSPSYINPHLKEVINYGRHWSQNLIMAARRTAEVHRDVTAQADVIVSFRQTERRDIQKMGELFSETELLPGLQKGEFVVIGEPEKTPFGELLRSRAVNRIE
jgi:hypothetical protein